MSRKLITLVGASLLAITMSGCGYQGHFRYTCQDPVNWETAECQPPVCQATGTCTHDVLGYNPLATESGTIEDIVVEEADAESGIEE